MPASSSLDVGRPKLVHCMQWYLCPTLCKTKRENWSFEKVLHYEWFEFLPDSFLPYNKRCRNARGKERLIQILDLIFGNLSVQPYFFSLIGPESLQGSILKFNQCMLHFRCILVLLCQNAFALKDVQQNPYKKLTVCPKCTFSNATFYPGLAAEALHKVPIVSLREPKHCIFIAKFHFFNLWTL